MEKFKDLKHITYIVGGAVRNELLNIPSHDIDFVVQCDEQLFRETFPCEKTVPKVGVSFPVFLLDGYEVALTRSERSTGNSYQDFVLTGVGVPIETDLGRRDFTMNSLAKHVVTGNIIDPFGGVDDINNKVIRTVNNEFVKEDPLRIYRAARFAAEFGFSIDRNTADIIKRDGHFLKNVRPERVYTELTKMYDRSEKPSTFFRVLLFLGVLKYHFKPIELLSHISSGPSKYHKKIKDVTFEYNPDTDAYTLVEKLIHH